MPGEDEAAPGRECPAALVGGSHDEHLVDAPGERRVGRAGHRDGRLSDGEDGHARRDEDELPLTGGEDRADSKGVAAPPDRIAHEPAGLGGRDGGAIELCEEIARLQSGRSLLDGRG
jgi:hypothetical protein